MTTNSIILHAMESLRKNPSTQVLYAYNRTVAYVDASRMAYSPLDKKAYLSGAEWWAMAARRAALEMC